jgi:hypothetical protein
MAYAKSLRVIGQSLEAAKLWEFELEKDDLNYLVRSDSLSSAGEWILRHALSTNDSSEPGIRPSRAVRPLRFTPADISRLDDQARRQRRFDSSRNSQVYRRLSQLLRTIGDQLDRWEVRAFRISWTSSSVVVEFQSADGQSDYRTFSAEKLEQLGSHSRFRRSSTTRFDAKSPHFLGHKPPKR